MGKPTVEDLKILLANRLKNAGFTDKSAQHKWIGNVEVTKLVGWLIDSGHVTEATMFDVKKQVAGFFDKAVACSHDPGKLQG